MIVVNKICFSLLERGVYEFKKIFKTYANNQERKIQKVIDILTIGGRSKKIMKQYQHLLEEKGIRQSMSKKETV